MLTVEYINTQFNDIGVVVVTSLIEPEYNKLLSKSKLFTTALNGIHKDDRAIYIGVM